MIRVPVRGAFIRALAGASSLCDASRRWAASEVPKPPPYRDEEAVRAAAKETERARESHTTPAEAIVKPDLSRPVINDLGNEEFELVGFMKPSDVAVAGTSGRLPCEIPGSDAEAQANEAEATAQRKKEEKAKAKPKIQLHQSRSEKDKQEIRDASATARPAEESDPDAAARYRENVGGFADSRDVWRRMAKSRDQVIQELSAEAQMGTTELEYLRLERLIKDEDKYHWRIGQLGYDDEVRRNDFYSLHVIAMQLNKARWLNIEVAAKKGQKTTGANVRSHFWQESLFSIIEKGRMVEGQFVESHPTLRPFADCVKRRRLTKAFLRGFVDTRLKVMPQPANMQQLFDHFDKMYGYLYNAQLEILDVRRNDAAEHMMMHLGRANGLTQHCVLLWREYARRGTTMLPADICADNQVNLALLKNISLASIDRCVRRTLAEVMFHVRNEMDHVRALAPLIPTKAWPLLLESFLPNYYVRFLEKNDYDVTRWLVEQHGVSPGLLWYFYKQMWRWNRDQALTDLVSDVAPVPIIPEWIQRQPKPRKPAEVPDDINKAAAKAAQK